MSLPGFKTLRSLLVIYYSCSLTFTEVLRSPGPVPNALRAFVPVGQGPLLSGSRGCGDGDLGGGWGLRGHAAGERQSRAANPGQRESRAHASPPLCGPAGSASPSACPCADDPPTPSHHAASSSALSGVTRPASHFCPPVPLSSTETSLPLVTHRPLRLRLPSRQQLFTFTFPGPRASCWRLPSPGSLPICCQVFQRPVWGPGPCPSPHLYSPLSPLPSNLCPPSPEMAPGEATSDLHVV